MKNTLNKIIQGYKKFREKYAQGDKSVMERLAYHGQEPKIMLVSCCDSRVDPSLILQCEPGELFTIRNVANIVPPYESDDKHHGTSAALEFGITGLNVKHLIILGHSQCGGIQALLNSEGLKQNDFISGWVSHLQEITPSDSVDEAAKKALFVSYDNCLSFPWIKERVDNGSLSIHLWFFGIKSGEIQAYSHEQKEFALLA